jgi:hypothetical protein
MLRIDARRWRERRIIRTDHAAQRPIFSRRVENADKIWVFDASCFFFENGANRVRPAIVRPINPWRRCVKYAERLVKKFVVESLAKVLSAVDSGTNRANRPK